MLRLVNITSLFIVIVQSNSALRLGLSKPEDIMQMYPEREELILPPRRQRL